MPEDRGTRRLIWVGVLALVTGAVLSWVIWHREPAEPGPASAAGSVADRTVDGRPFVSRAGGFAVTVPAGMKRIREGDGARFVDRRRGVVVTVGPTAGGTLQDARRGLLRAMRQGYGDVEVATTRRDRVDGRRALSTYGTARTRGGQDLRFALVVVRAKPRSFGIATFTAAGSDPAKVLPRATTITRSFRVLDRG